MWKNHKILGLIPARGGSKGILRKNLRELGGKPLLAWSIEAAHNSRYLDRVVLSSEDAEIIEAAKNFGCEAPFVRPAELATDNAPGIAPVLHALEMLQAENYDYIVLLQPTSPLRQAMDIDAAIELCLENNAPTCVSVTQEMHNPWWMFTLDDKKRLLPLLSKENMPLRRQDAPETYSLNGAVYVARCDYLLEHKSFLGPETIAYAMPPERAIDIDRELDLELAELLLNKNEN